MDHEMPDLTDEQRANLTKLAAYLRTLPPEYPDFAMSLFTQDGNGAGKDVAHVSICGTAACAAGHGPVAGIAPVEGETWIQYSLRAFCGEPGWAWCFAEDWSTVDNTAHGAAARISYMLEFGVPEDCVDQLYGHAPLSYEIPA